MSATSRSKTNTRAMQVVPVSRPRASKSDIKAGEMYMYGIELVNEVELGWLEEGGAKWNMKRSKCCDCHRSRKWLVEDGTCGSR